MSPRVGQGRTSTSDTRVADADVTDGEAVTNMMGGYKFKVEHVRARWTRDDGGPWELTWCEMIGPRILKSGKLSPAQHGTWLVGHMAEDAPAWLAAWLREAGPTEWAGPEEEELPNLTTLQQKVLLAMVDHGGAWPHTSTGALWKWDTVSHSRQLMAALAKKGVVEHIEADRYEVSPVGRALAEKIKK